MPFWSRRVRRARRRYRCNGSNRVTRTKKRTIQEDGTMKNEVTFNFKDGRSETGWMVFNKVKQ